MDYTEYFGIIKFFHIMIFKTVDFHTQRKRLNPVLQSRKFYLLSLNKRLVWSYLKKYDKIFSLSVTKRAEK